MLINIPKSPTLQRMCKRCNEMYVPDGRSQRICRDCQEEGRENWRRKNKNNGGENGKKLTDKDKRLREISKVVLKIKKFEKLHNQDIVESACVRYKKANVDKRNATEEIKVMEDKLSDAKRRLK